jgi:hypothetical protein
MEGGVEVQAEASPKQDTCAFPPHMVVSATFVLLNTSEMLIQSHRLDNVDFNGSNLRKRQYHQLWYVISMLVPVRLSRYAIE